MTVAAPAPSTTSVVADRGYDHDKYRREAWRRGVKPVIARRATGTAPASAGAAGFVERTFAWLHNFRRLPTRYERRAELHQAFLHLGCAIICRRFLRAL